MGIFDFKPLCTEDLELLYNWFREPIINQLYAINQDWSFENIKQKYLPRILGLERVPSFIIFQNNKPIGFIQYYCLTESLPEGILDYRNLLFDEYNPNEIAGIDLFIANDIDRGKGLGEKIITNFINENLTQFRAIIVDPEKTNSSAIRCYEKTGFVKIPFSQEPNYIVMIKELNSVPGGKILMDYNKIIYKLELSLLTPEIRRSADQLRLLIADNFVEFGSSGTIYHKKDLLNYLPIEEPKQYTMNDFKTYELSEGVILATYKVTIDSQSSLRSSIWKLNGDSWQIIFHQGTNTKD